MTSPLTATNDIFSQCSTTATFDEEEFAVYSNPSTPKPMYAKYFFRCAEKPPLALAKLYDQEGEEEEEEEKQDAETTLIHHQPLPIVRKRERKSRAVVKSDYATRSKSKKLQKV